MIKRLLTPGSISELSMRPCILGKINFLLGQTVYSLWWPSLTKDLQTEIKERGSNNISKNDPKHNDQYDFFNAL